MIDARHWNSWGVRTVRSRRSTRKPLGRYGAVGSPLHRVVRTQPSRRPGRMLRIVSSRLPRMQHQTLFLAHRDEAVPRTIPRGKLGQCHSLWDSHEALITVPEPEQSVHGKTLHRWQYSSRRLGEPCPLPQMCSVDFRWDDAVVLVGIDAALPSTIMRLAPAVMGKAWVSTVLAPGVTCRANLVRLRAFEMNLLRTMQHRAPSLRYSSSYRHTCGQMT